MCSSLLGTANSLTYRTVGFLNTLFRSNSPHLTIVILILTVNTCNNFSQSKFEGQTIILVTHLSQYADHFKTQRDVTETSVELSLFHYFNSSRINVKSCLESEISGSSQYVSRPYFAFLQRHRIVLSRKRYSACNKQRLNSIINN